MNKKNVLTLVLTIVTLSGALYAFKQTNGSPKPNWSNRFIAPSTNCQVGLTINHQNGTQVAAGQFGSFSSNIFYFDNGQLDLKFNLVTNSFTTGNKMVDSIMVTESWLSGGEHESISFVTNSSTNEGGKIVLKGDLTIKGITKQVTMYVKPIKKRRSSNEIDYFTLDGEISVPRSMFDVAGQRDWYPSPWKVDMTLDKGSEMKFNLYFIAQSWSKKWGENIFSQNDNPVGKIYKEIKSKGVKKGLKLYEQIKKESPDAVDENTLGYVSFVLTLGSPTGQEFDQALELFEYNIKQFPKQTTAKKNYAETLAMAGKIEESKEWYSKVMAEDASQIEQDFFDYYGIK